MSLSKEITIKHMQVAVKSFRVCELNKCFQLLGMKKDNRARKAEMQARILRFLEDLEKQQCDIPRCAVKIFKLERCLKNSLDRRGLFMSSQPTNATMPVKESPFFETVQIFAHGRIAWQRTISFSVGPPHSTYLRKKKTKGSRFQYEVQIMFRNCKEAWKPQEIHIRINGNELKKLQNAPQIIYITSDIKLGKYILNNIFLEIPGLLVGMDYRVSLVKRFTAEQLLKSLPVESESLMVPRIKGIFRRCKKNIYDISLVCPFEKKLMQYPCLCLSCKHPEVFDLMHFLCSMEYNLHWNCPVCRGKVTYKSLRLDKDACEYLNDEKAILIFQRQKATHNTLSTKELQIEKEIIMLND